MFQLKIEKCVTAVAKLKTSHTKSLVLQVWVPAVAVAATVAATAVYVAIVVWHWTLISFDYACIVITNYGIIEMLYL